MIIDKLVLWFSIFLARFEVEVLLPQNSGAARRRPPNPDPSFEVLARLSGGFSVKISVYVHCKSTIVSHRLKIINL